MTPGAACVGIPVREDFPINTTATVGSDQGAGRISRLRHVNCWYMQGSGAHPQLQRRGALLMP
jgi:hypothetical protein